MTGSTGKPFHRKATLRRAKDAAGGGANVPAGAPERHRPRVASKSMVVAPYLLPKPIDTPKENWRALRLVSTGVRQHFLGGMPLINFFRTDPAAKAFDLLRTRLLQTLRAKGWNRVAIASPHAGCGTTFTAVNLAQSLARIPGSRTILMDLNQRTPGVADALDIHGVGDMPGFLRGDVALNRHLVRTGDTLALGLTTRPQADAAELLHDARSGEVLGRMMSALCPEVVLYDLPPVLAYDDFAAFLPQVDGVLLVSDGTRTTARHIADCERIIQGQTRLLGVILNRARSSDLEAV